MALRAVQHIRRMRGGSQSHLMKAGDGNLYVVKFLNSPQQPRLLANEYFATLLARQIGLPVPDPVVIAVDEELIRSTPQLIIELQWSTIPCEAGEQFGSRYVLLPSQGVTEDVLSSAALHRIGNIESFAGMLAYDMWTCNLDTRQAVYWKANGAANYKASFIDFGWCFNKAAWKLPNTFRHWGFADREFYTQVLGWESFEPWLSSIESLDESVLADFAQQIPSAWYGADVRRLDGLVKSLALRRKRVRQLLAGFRDSSFQPFPNWIAALAPAPPGEPVLPAACAA